MYTPASIVIFHCGAFPEIQGILVEFAKFYICILASCLTLQRAKTVTPSVSLSRYTTGSPGTTGTTGSPVIKNIMA